MEVLIVNAGLAVLADDIAISRNLLLAKAVARAFGFWRALRASGVRHLPDPPLVISPLS